MAAWSRAACGRSSPGSPDESRPALVALLAHAPALWADWVLFDDREMLLEHAALDDWSALPSLLWRDYFAHAGQTHGMYRPGVLVSYFFDRRFGGDLPFYYLCSLLDGYSRSCVHWEIREAMKEVDVEVIVQRARERFPDARPRLITDNGPQFIARDFKVFLRLAGMTHVRTSPYYPQSNGKIERWHRTLKHTTIRPKAPTSLDAARAVVAEFVHHYNHVRLHGAIGYVTPADKLAGRETAIWAERDRKLEAARAARAQRRQQARQTEEAIA